MPLASGRCWALLHVGIRPLLRAFWRRAILACLVGTLLPLVLLGAIKPLFGSFEQDYLLNGGLLGRYVWRFIDSRAAAHHDRAYALYVHERERILANARTQPLRAYWARTAGLVNPAARPLEPLAETESYYSMVYKRLVALNAELDDGRDGFRVEKDKCALAQHRITSHSSYSI